MNSQNAPAPPPHHSVQPPADRNIFMILQKSIAFCPELWYHNRADLSKTEYGRLAQLVEHLLDVQVRVLYRPPYSSYSNPILYEKGFGYVFCLQEVLRRDYSER